jgi:hypothetical protein
MDLQLVSPPLHWIGNHYSYERLCEQVHPELNKFDCAVAYGYHKKHDDFDRIMDTDRTFFGYFDDVLQLKPLFVLRDASKYLLYAGLFFNIMGIELD